MASLDLPDTLDPIALSAVAPASTPRVAPSPPPFLQPALASTTSDEGLRQRSRREGVSVRAAEGGGPAHGRVEADEDDEEVDQSMLRWGYCLVFGSTLSFFLGLWSILIGPYTQPSGVWILDALAKDTYYKYLVVLLVPVTVCFVIVNWWGLKIFRHS